MSKAADYGQLVAERKACHLCEGLTNPADVERGRFDSDHIGAWSLWQGNLDASLMVVGQDWGDRAYFLRHEGREGPRNPTNLALVELAGLAGVQIGGPGSAEGRDVAFFTNAILCLKVTEGGLQGKVQPPWFSNCARFLRRQIEIISPAVVVGLGELAYRAILSGFGLKCGPFRAEVEAASGRTLPNCSRAFAMYHCGVRGSRINRRIELQREDWKRLRPFLATGQTGHPAGKVRCRRESPPPSSIPSAGTARRSSGSAGMDYFFYNTDAKSLIDQPRPRFGVLIKEGFAASGGARRFGEQLGRLAENDMLLMYENGLGVVAVGKVKKRWDGVSYAAPIYYTAREMQQFESGVPCEYRISVDWFLDLSDSPFRVDEIRKRLGYNPRGTIQRIVEQQTEVARIIDNLVRRWGASS